jgi:uncharacterized protein YceH (UPF0502 family)
VGFYMYRREFDKFGNQTCLCFTVSDNECEHEIESSSHRHTSFDGVNECEHEVESSSHRHTSFDGVNECEHEVESSCQRHTSFDGVNECELELESSCEKHHVPTKIERIFSMYQPSKRKCTKRKRNKKH